MRVLLALSLCLLIAPQAAQAALYAPGATLDPACAPTDSNCGVQSNTAVGTLGQVPYYAAAGNLLAATSTMTILSNGNVGIGTTTPFTKFSVAGSVTILDGTQGLNKVFTSDANGTGSWQGNLTWASGTYRTVYFMGDSLTEDGTYVYQIQSSLGTTWTGFNRGIGGQTTTNMLARFATDVTTNSAASYVVILGGTNDVAGIGGIVSAATIESNLQSMYTAAHNAGIKVVAVTITPRTTTAPQLAIQQAVNTWITTAATNVDYIIDPYVSLADPSNPTQLLPAYTTDGLHMTTSGYNVLGSAIYAGVTWTGKVSSGNLTVSGTALVNQDVTRTGNPYFNTINDITVGKGGGSVQTNTALGFQTLLSNTLGKYNTSMGWNSLEFNTTGVGNSAFGSQALSSNTTGSNNTAGGVQALTANTTGYNNTANGGYSLVSNTTGFSNTANGMYALFSNTTGYTNTAVGQQSLFSNTAGISNTATGVYALYSNTTGNNNTAAGNGSLASNTTGGSNTASGVNALYFNTTGYNNTANGVYSLNANSTGFSNTAVGVYALLSNTTAYGNVAVGQQALGSNTTGSANTVLGYEAGHYQSDGTVLATTSNSVYIGASSRGYSNSDNNSIVIGYNAVGLGANTVVLGNSSITTTSLNGKVGIGTTTPFAKLSIQANAGETNGTLFAIGSSTSAYATTTLFSIANTGDVTIKGSGGGTCTIGNGSGATSCTSDERLKTNIALIVDPLKGIEQLRGVTFNWKDPTKNQQQFIGVIAQDVQKVFPQAVVTNADGYLAVDYAVLVAPLIEAVKELAGKVSGFAQSITTAVLNATTVNVKNLCLTDSSGSTCYTRSQLNSLLNQEGQQSNFVTNASPITITDVPLPDVIPDTASTTPVTSDEISTTTPVTSEVVASTTSAE